MENLIPNMKQRTATILTLLEDSSELFTIDEIASKTGLTSKVVQYDLRYLMQSNQVVCVPSVVLPNTVYYTSFKRKTMSPEKDHAQQECKEWQLNTIHKLFADEYPRYLKEQEKMSPEKDHAQIVYDLLCATPTPLTANEIAAKTVLLRGAVHLALNYLQAKQLVVNTMADSCKAAELYTTAEKYEGMQLRAQHKMEQAVPLTPEQAKQDGIMEGFHKGFTQGFTLGWESGYKMPKEAPKPTLRELVSKTKSGAVEWTPEDVQRLFEQTTGAL